MGNSRIKQTKKQLNSQQYNWLLKSATSFSILVYDEKTNLQGEKFNIDFSLIDKQSEYYILRKQSSKHLVAVYDIIQEEQSHICSSTKTLSVVIEPIPYRLSDLGEISFLEGMYIIKCVLEGYKVLKQNKVGYYLLDQINICFTNQGICKFWVNQNLHLSIPHSNRIISESIFVESLVQIIEMRINKIDQSYSELKKSIENYTINGFLSLVSKFESKKVQNVASICSMGKLFSPTSTKCTKRDVYKHINYGKAEEKVSISKYKQANRRKSQQNQYKPVNIQSIFMANNPDKNYGDQPKKLSLSFKKSRRDQIQQKSSSKRIERRPIFSPRKNPNLNFNKLYHGISLNPNQNRHKIQRMYEDMHNK